MAGFAVGIMLLCAFGIFGYLSMKKRIVNQVKQNLKASEELEASIKQEEEDVK